MNIYSVIGRFLLFVFCLSGYSIGMKGQSLEQLINEAKSSQFSVEEQIKNLYAIVPEVKASNHSDTLGFLYYFIAYRHNSLNEVEELISSSSSSIKYLEQANYTGYRLVFNYYYRSKANKLLGQDKQAISDADFVIEKGTTGRGLEVLDDVIQIRSAIYRENGEYESAVNEIEYFLTTDFFDKIDLYSKGLILLDLSLAYSNFYDSISIAKAIQAINDSKVLLPKIEDSFDRSKLQILNIMQSGFIYYKHKDYKKTIDAYETALSLIAKDTHNQEQKVHRITAIGNLISLYAETRNYSEAKRLIENLESENIDVSDEYFNMPLSVLFENIADYHTALQQFEQTELAIKKAYNVLGIDKHNKTSELINNEKRQRITKILLAEIRLDESRYAENTEVLFLERALERMYELDTIVDYINQNLLFDSSILNWRKEAKSVYEKGVELAFQLNDHHSFWLFIEKAKGLALLEGISNDQYFQTQEELNDVRKELKNLQLENSRLKTTLEYEDSLIINKKAQKDLLHKRTDLIKKKIPEIVNLKQQMEDNTDHWVVQYFVSNTEVYAITVHDNKSEIYSLGNSETLLEDIYSFRHYLNADIEDQENYASLNKVLHRLYKTLIEPINITQGHITIIPDDNLFLLPFGCLMDSDQQFFIQSHSIQYQLSASLSTKDQESQPVKRSFILAPYYENTEFDFLEYSAQEAKMVREYTFKNSQETNNKSDIIDQYTNTDIFHFAGHAVANQQSSKSSYLALMDNTSLTEEEIYNYPNSLKMVVLTACNTGVGHILEGEGISNLTRSFIYSGASSVVQSLWSINDASSYSIIEGFYKALHNGEDKSKALQSAKVNFLNSADDFQRHPYYWSGVVLVGNDTSFDFRKFSLFPGILFFALVAGLVTLFLNLYKKN